MSNKEFVDAIEDPRTLKQLVEALEKLYYEMNAGIKKPL